MENQAKTMEALFDKTEHYVRTSADVIKLKAIDSSADMISTLAARLSIMAFLIIIIIMSNIGIAWWIGVTMGAIYYGFLIVAGFYTGIALLVYIFQGRLIKRPVNDFIITQLMKNKIAITAITSSKCMIDPAL